MMARVSAIGSEYVVLVLTRREAEAAHSRLAMLTVGRGDGLSPIYPPWNGRAVAASKRVERAVADGVALLRRA